MNGAKLNCYFTVEKIHRPRDPDDLRPYVKDDEEITSVGALLEKLARDVPGAAFVRNKKNPAVIHAIDKGLLDLDGYGLETRIDLDYSGVLADLSWALEKKLDNVGARRWGFNTTLFDDHVTKVEIHAKEQKVRDILTDCVPLEGGYSPLLWFAETTIVDGKPKTTVQYYGPRRWLTPSPPSR
jgi:hypothetical protein